MGKITAETINEQFVRDYTCLQDLMDETNTSEVPMPQRIGRRIRSAALTTDAGCQTVLRALEDRRLSMEERSSLRDLLYRRLDAITINYYGAQSEN